MRRNLFTFWMLALLSLSAAHASLVHTAKARRSAAPTAAPRLAASASRTGLHHAASRPARASIRPTARTATAKRRQPPRSQPVAASHPAAKAHPVQRISSAVQSPRRAQAAPAVRPAAVEGVALRRSRAALPPPLRGSMESLVRQNERTEADGLERIQDDDDLADRIQRKVLVPLPTSPALAVNEKLPENRRYCRPWTATFLSDLARVHAAAFHTALEVTSAVRTVEFQKQLMRINGNATAAEGDVASPHLTGATIDIAKQGMTRQQLGWMRSWLLPLQTAGKIDVEEEFKQACFHITVYKSYGEFLPSTQSTAEALRLIAGRSGL